MTTDQITELLSNRIAELKEIDKELCRKRWDSQTDSLERNIYREQSNETTARRHELEELRIKIMQGL